MTTSASLPFKPRVVVIADVESNAAALVEKVLRPAGLDAWVDSDKSPDPDVLIVDVTQLMGDPLSGLRNRRAGGDNAPAVILAARIPQSRLRDFFRLGVADILMKPYRPEELVDAIKEIAETRSRETNTQFLARKLETSREHLRQRSEEIRLLSEIGRTVVSLGDLDRILMRLVEAAAFVTDAEEANIYLADGGSDELVLRATKQAGERNATLQRLRVNDTLVGQVFRTGQPTLRQPSQEAGPVKIQTGFLVQSLINVPIRADKYVIGVLGVYNRLASRPFTEHHLTLMKALADWAGVALEHAELLHAPKTAETDTGQMEPRPLMAHEPISDALERLDSFVGNGRYNFTEEQLAVLEGLRLSLKRTIKAAPITTPSEDEIQPASFDLASLINEILERLQPEAARQGLDLVFGPPLPLAPFEGDPLPIRQIIKHLTVNAIYRTKQGRVVINLHRLEIAEGEIDGFEVPSYISLEDGIYICMTVADSSPGLSPDVVEALRSDQVDTSAGREGPGFTMGEIRLIADGIGGVLWHDQTPTGTTIVLALPVG